jgi:hypothetical protein
MVRRLGSFEKMPTILMIYRSFLSHLVSVRCSKALKSFVVRIIHTPHHNHNLQCTHTTPHLVSHPPSSRSFRHAFPSHLRSTLLAFGINSINLIGQSSNQYRSMIQPDYRLNDQSTSQLVDLDPLPPILPSLTLPAKIQREQRPRRNGTASRHVPYTVETSPQSRRSGTCVLPTSDFRLQEAGWAGVWGLRASR